MHYHLLKYQQQTQELSDTVWWYVAFQLWHFAKKLTMWHTDEMEFHRIKEASKFLSILKYKFRIK